jgi:hypothetical protein
VSRIWSKPNSYPYVLRTFCNSICASAQKERHNWTKGLQRKSSVSGLYRRKCFHLSSLLILFGNLRATERTIDISTVRWETFDARKKLEYLNTFWPFAATHYSDARHDWALKSDTQQPTCQSTVPSLFANIHLEPSDIHHFLGIYISSTLFPFFYCTFLRKRSLTFISFCLYFIFYPFYFLSCFIYFSFLLYFFPLYLSFRCWSLHLAL